MPNAHQRREAKTARRVNRLTNPAAQNYSSPMSRALKRAAQAREGQARMGLGRR